jgi:multicomponent Na+:H+ antiporter subunit C
MTQFVLALVLGLLFAIGTFLVLRRDIVRVVWGVTIIGQTANVYLVTMGGFEGGVPFVAHGGGASGQTDPLVQALVLTAIVIGFGTTAFALVLTYRVHEAHGTIDMDELAESGPTDAELAATDAPSAGDETVATDGGENE